MGETFFLYALPPREGPDCDELLEERHSCSSLGLVGASSRAFFVQISFGAKASSAVALMLRCCCC
jgi:hypothetical protein